MTGMPPYHDKLERSIIYTVVVRRELPGRPEEYIPTNSEDGNKLWGLLVTCWSFEPEERPSAAVVAQTVSSDNITPRSILVIHGAITGGNHYSWGFDAHQSLVNQVV